MEAGRLGALAYGVDGDVYVAGWDGANPIRIADGRPPNNRCPVGEYSGDGPIWSPDGRYLAYRHADCEGARHGWWDVVISDPKGNVVASFPSQGWLISWSPDSTRVAVWVRNGQTIGIYGLDGVRQTLLTVPPGMKAPGDYDPVWLPNGASLLVPHDVEVPLDGSTPRKLPWADRDPTRVTFSPDGSRVAYTVDWSLFVAAADGSDARQVIERWVQNPVWSPTGGQIAFTYSEEIDSFYASEVRVLEVATGTITSLVGTGGSDALMVIGFSPKGDRILYSEDGGSGVGSLWSVHVDGSEPRRLVAGTYWGDWQSVSPVTDPDPNAQ